MKKRKGILGFFFAAFILAGCISQAENTGHQEKDQIEMYALVTKAEGNIYNDLIAEGFQKVIDEAGGNSIIASPKEPTAEAQLEMLYDLISRGVKSIAVAANDAEALSEVLQEARSQGIKVSTVDSDVNPADRQIFVNQVSTETIARTLVDAVYDISGGSGQWAILSATSTATNQNAWIRAMRKVLEEEKYRDLRLVDIVYGDDESDTSRRMTEKLLEEYKDLKVICAPTVIGLRAVAEVVTESGDSGIKITGLGLPSDMAPYVTGEDPVCPTCFLWDPIDLGRMSAYVSLALVSGEITGASGEVFQAGDLGMYTLEESENESVQVIVAPPIRFDAANIEEWKEFF